MYAISNITKVNPIPSPNTHSALTDNVFSETTEQISLKPGKKHLLRS